MGVLPSGRHRMQDNVRRSGARRAGPTEPARATVGDTYYDTNAKILFVYSGSNWDPVNPPTYLKTAKSGSGSTASKKFVNWPGPIDLSFTKYATHTKLVVVGTASLSATAPDTMIAKALRIHGVDYPIGNFFFNAASEHMLTGIGVDFASGLAAGRYTARLCWRSVTGETIQVDANDAIYYQLQETV